MTSKLELRRAALRRPAASAAGLALVLTALTASLLPLGADFQNYADYFGLAREGPWAETLEARFEPLFAALVVALVHLASADVLVFAALVALSLFIKLRVFIDLASSRAMLAALLVYYAARYLPLHELTQIRLAIGLSLTLLALNAASAGTAGLMMLAAVLTHYSTVLMIPVLLAWRMAARAPRHYARWESLIVVTGAAGIAVLALLLEPLLEQLSLVFAILDLYSREGFGEDAVNLLSLAVLLDGTLLALAWLMGGRDLRARFWLSVLTLSMVAFYVLVDFPVLAHRVREMMSLCWMLYLAAALRRRGTARAHAMLSIAVTVPAYLYLNFIGNNALFRLDGA